MICNNSIHDPYLTILQSNAGIIGAGFYNILINSVYVIQEMFKNNVTATVYIKHLEKCSWQGTETDICQECHVFSFVGSKQMMNTGDRRGKFELQMVIFANSANPKQLLCLKIIFVLS